MVSICKYSAGIVVSGNFWPVTKFEQSYFRTDKCHDKGYLSDMCQN